jgi:hypothetical protein
MRREIGIVTIIAAALVAACGGTNTAPTGPSTVGAVVPGAPSGPFATITGSVQAPSAGVTTMAIRGAALTSLTVSVVGTTISANVDGNGRFTLVGVPTGAVQLRFSGAGTDATLTVDTVQAAQTVDLVVVVSGTTASIDSSVRSGAGQAELEGRVESLPPTMPALTFKAAGHTVKTDTSTRFLDGSATRAFSDLTIGMRVHATGTMAADTLTASAVEMQNSNPVAVEINGVIDTLTGSASAFQFKIGSAVIKGDSQTVFSGDGDTAQSFANLKNGSRVEVKGEQRDGFVYATRLHLEGIETTPPDDTSASIDGVLNTIAGSTPTLTLTVDTTTVHTSSSTTVQRRGDTQTLDALKVGQRLHVVGTRRSDTSIDARLIEIEDEAEGAEFEIEGSLGGLRGACPSIQFSVNGFSISTSASTTFEGATCSALKSGDTVGVKGTKLADGSVAATRVKKD